VEYESQAIDSYLRCPLKYKYEHIDKRKPETRLIPIIRTLTMDSVYSILESDEELAFDSLDGFIADLDVRAQLAANSIAGSAKTATRVLTIAPQLLAKWYTSYYPNMRGGKPGDLSPVEIAPDLHIAPEPHIVCRKAVVIPRFRAERSKMCYMLDFSIILTSIATKSPNITLLVFDVPRCTLLLHSVTFTEARAEFARQAALKARRGIEEGFFPPANPASRLCNRLACQYWRHCKEHIFSAKSS